MRRRVAFAAMVVAARHGYLFARPFCEAIIVRHGETDWNRQLRVQGTTDVALNTRGKLQATMCASSLAKQLKARAEIPHLVYSSELQRASATAAAIAEALGPSIRVEKDPRLNEWNLGSIEGMRKDEAAAQHASDWAVFSRWCSSDVPVDVTKHCISGGGESMEHVRARATRCIEEACAASSCGLIIAVTHGGVLGQLLRHSEPSSTPPRPKPTNACISRFRVRPEGQWEVLSWSSSTHLSGDAAPAEAEYGTHK
mmetsp:Transcript_50722/g.94790  ORF Transcript_50722/g.94790 Transcript_50722/m.94790 type:complete len:255 (+) Transcript_50722:34-798(+)